MDIDWIRRPRRPDGGDGTLNLCFNALDRHVVHGHADDPAIEGAEHATFARLLEEVAAFGGVLRAFGVNVGDTVVARLPVGRDALVALLASARLGAVHVVEQPTGADAVVALPGPAVVIRRAGHVDPDDLDWDVLLRAGRTDPAPCAEVSAGSPALVVGGRSHLLSDVVAHRATDRSGSWELDALATLSAGGPVRLQP